MPFHKDPGMATTNNKKANVHNARSNQKRKPMSVGVLEKLGIVAKKKAKADPIKDIVDRCKAGDPYAFRQLFEKHVNGVHRHLSFLIGPHEDVDDLVQLVFLNVFQSIKRFKGNSAFSTWLFRVTINVARQEIRTRSRYRRLNGAIIEVNNVLGTTNTKTPERHLANWQQIYNVLDKISFKKRETFILYMYEGYSLEEIAELLGLPVSTIGSRLQAGRRELLNIIAGEKTI